MGHIVGICRGVKLQERAMNWEYGVSRQKHRYSTESLLQRSLLLESDACSKGRNLPNADWFALVAFEGLSLWGKVDGRCFALDIAIVVS